MSAQPILEIGGTHVTAASVDTRTWEVQSHQRTAVDSGGAAHEILDAFASAMRSIPADSRRWAIAIPGPFDYAQGIGDFDGVAKFGALNGRDIGAELRGRLPGIAEEFVFVNDADAFAMGEWMALEAPSKRGLFLTLGTGIGSSYLDDGVPVHSAPGLPPDGHAYRLTFQGHPLEETVSRRALIGQYRAQTGRTRDVHEIAAEALQGSGIARAVFEYSFESLGKSLSPSVRAFDTDVIVIGGSIAGSWELVAESLSAGLSDGGAAHVRVRPAKDPNTSPLMGTARAAQVLRSAPHRP